MDSGCVVGFILLVYLHFISTNACMRSNLMYVDHMWGPKYLVDDGCDE